MTKLLLTLALLSIVIHCSKYSDTPETTFQTIETQARAICLSIKDAEPRIVVGYNSSRVAVYKSDGSHDVTRQILLGPVVDLFWWSLGFVSFHAQGNLYTFKGSSDDGSANFRNITPATGVLSGVYGRSGDLQFGAANLGTFVRQYRLNGLSNDTFIKQYNLTVEGLTIGACAYSSDKKYFYASASNGSIYVFDAELNAQVTNFNPGAPISKIKAIGGTKAIGITSAKQIVRFNETGMLSLLGASPQDPINIQKCRDTNYFIVLDSTRTIFIYNSDSGQNEQTISTTTIPVDMDCNDEYLVTVDTNGNVTVFHYYGFPTWAYFVIGAAVLIIIIVAAVCYYKKRLTKKKNQDGSTDKTAAAKTFGKDYKNYKKLDDKIEDKMPDNVKEEKEKQKSGFTAFFKEKFKKISS